MRQDNKLNKALKNAFEGHMEPLRDAQWSRLAMELEEEKPKRRILPWFLLSFAVAVLCLGIGYWLGREAPLQAGKSHTNPKALEQGTVQDRPVGKDNDAVANSAGVNSGNNIFTDKEGHSPSGGHGTPGHIYRSGRNAPVVNNNRPHSRVYDEDDAGEEHTLDRPSVSKDPEGFEPGLTLALMPYRRFTTHGISEDAIRGESLEKLRMDRRQNWPKLGPVHYKRLVIGFSAGVSVVNFGIANIDQPEKVHKDVPVLFESTTSKSNSLFGNLNVDIGISERWPLSLSTGFQYRRISQDVDLDYTLREIPVRRSDGTILGYATSPGVLKMQYNGKNYLSFINMPAKLAYTFTPGLKKKNEFQVSGGFNLSFLASVSGQTFDFNEIRVVPLRESIKNVFNAGWIGGLQYNRHVYRSWWAGIEGQWQRNTLKYDAGGYGALKSRIIINSYNLHLQYKF